MIPIETPSQILSELNLQEDDCQTVACIVCDTYRNAHKVTIKVQASATCQTLLGRVANRLGYSSGTFLLYHQEPDGAENAEEGVCLNDLPTASLQSVVGNNLRQNFYITMKEGVVQKEEFLNTADTEDLRRNPDPPDVKPIQLVSIINDCSTSNMSNSKENKVNYGCYSLSSALFKSDTGYVGLVNQAMTCYLNSLLQTLYMTPEFRNAVYRWEYEGTSEEAVKSIPYQLQKLFLMLQTSDKKSVGTTDITKSFGWDSSDAWHQHDIQELCRVMFDALEKTWQNTEQADLINQLYQGRMKDCVQCLQCAWESSKTVAYQDIPLAVKPFGEGRAYSTVEESLRAFCSHELLDGNNQWFCEKCNTKVDAHKSLKFITFPYLLTMHLMRFDFDYNTLRRIKLNHRISFPEVLNLNDFIVKTESTSTDCVTGQSLEQETANDTNTFSANCESACSSSSTNNDCAAMDSSESELPARDQDSYPKGPYEYELFSIMVHSGNASGGHYYAYIKSFERDQWFSFNDQNVSAITYDDIKKTYGGSSSVHGHYSSSFASSTNAYMLMYRRIDKERNAKFMRVDQFPVHLQRELKRMQDREDSERRQQEMERNTCKIKLFVFHPVELKLLEATLAIHMDRTLAEATEVAWKLFELERIVPLDCVRLVKYDSPHDYIDRSFDGEENTSMHRILGGVKFFYGFDLLLEVKQPGQSFATYKPGGISVKVYVVDLVSETISFPVTVRAALSQTVGELRQLIAEELSVSADGLRCVLEMHSDLKQLLDPGRLLKVEGFTKSNKIFVEMSGAEDEAEVDFKNSHLFEILDRFENTIRIHVQLPITANDTDAAQLDSVETSSKNSFTTSSETVPLFDDSSLKLSSDFWNSDFVAANATNEVSHLPSDAAEDDPVNCNSNATSKVAAAVSNDSKPSVLSLTSMKVSEELCCDETRTKNCALSETLEEASTDTFGTQNGASTWEMDRGDWVNTASARESIYRSYFRATLQVNAETKERSLSVALDKRITLESLKICLQSYVGTTSDNFEVFRVTSNGEELEMKRLTESLTMCDDDCQFKVKIGRPLQKGEHRIKIHQLLINDPEPIKFLMEVVISKGMTVVQAKIAILGELKLKQIMDVPPVDRCRLRRKCWKNPGNIYSDSQAFDGQDICLVPNMDLLLEVLDAPDQLRVSREEQLSIYVRQWSPARYELGGIAEIIVDEDSSNDLIKKISAVSGLKEENVQFCKISGVVFPYDMSVFEIHTGLSWVPRDNSHSTLKTLSVYSDGAVFFYRDKTEPLKVLTSEEKKELQQRENARVLPASSSITSSWRKERALKIYLDETPKASSACS